MLNFIWLEQLEAVLTYIAQWNGDAGQRLQAAIQSCTERLPARPIFYRSGRVEGTREAVVHPNYIVVYRATVDAVEITAVVHARQEYP